MGSRPPLWTIVAAGIAAMATIARLLSVTFTASTTPLSASPRRRTTPAAALFGGVSSEVTTNSPDLRRLANALKEKDLSFYPSREVFQFGRPSHLSLGLPIGTELAPQRDSAGCRGVIGPFPQPLCMKGVAYEVSTDASTYTSAPFPCPIASSNIRYARSATISPPMRQCPAVGAPPHMPVPWA